MESQDQGISVTHVTETRNGVVVTDKLVLNDENVPQGGIPMRISIHPSYAKTLVKKLMKYC